MSNNASLSQFTSLSTLFVGRLGLSICCEHERVGCDDCAWIGEQMIPCKPTGRRQFIQRQRKVDGQMESYLVLIRGKRGGHRELRRNSKPRRDANSKKLAYLRRMEEKFAREAIADALAESA
jgi:hypothetical protein